MARSTEGVETRAEFATERAPRMVHVIDESKLPRLIALCGYACIRKASPGEGPADCVVCDDLWWTLFGIGGASR